MKTRILIIFVVLLLAANLHISVSACPPPPCPNPCEYWSGSECVCHEACCVDADCGTGVEECLGCNDDCYCEDDDNKCGSDECCDYGMCVDKCDTDGGPCEHDEPYIQAGCQSQSRDDLRCIPDQVGKTCMWILQYEYTSSAVCSDCAPGCSRTRDKYCAFWKSETCRNAFFIGCVCDYDGPEIERPKVGSGDHYICN